MGLRQVKKEAPLGGNAPPAHGEGRPTPGGEAPGWASSLSGRVRPPLRARPLGFLALRLFTGGAASRYFWPIPASSVITALKLLWTFGEEPS